MLIAVRAGYGAGQLVRPGLAGMQRVIGGRYLAQACLSAGPPTKDVLALGVEVDLVHAVSMLVLAVLDPRWRRTALRSAVVAAGFAVAGAREFHRVGATTQPRSAVSANVNGLSVLRDRWAERFASHLIPGYEKLVIKQSLRIGWR